jgi:hypothetical protein
VERGAIRVKQEAQKRGKRSNPLKARGAEASSEEQSEHGAKRKVSQAEQSASGAEFQALSTEQSVSNAGR